MPATPGGNLPADEAARYGLAFPDWGSFTAVPGTLRADNVDLLLSGRFTNRGIFEVADRLLIQAEGGIDNFGASIRAGGALGLFGASLDNRNGAIQAGSLTLALGGVLDNTRGRILIDKDATFVVGGDLINDSGRIEAGSLTLDVGGNLYNRTLYAVDQKGTTTTRRTEFDSVFGTTVTIHCDSTVTQSADLRAGIVARTGDLVLNVGKDLLVILTYGVASGAGAAVGSAVEASTASAAAASTAAGSAAAGSAAVGTVAGAAGAATTAGLMTLAAQATVSLINNKGNLGKTLSDLGREETLRSVATAMVTAGALSALAGSISVPNAEGSFTPLANVSGRSDLVAQIGKNVINNAASAVIDTAINGGDLGDKLGRAITTGVIDAAGASAANSVGDLSGFSNRMGHLVVGCALGAAKGGDCGSGAIGGLAGELAAEWYGGDRAPVSATQASKTVDVARLFGALAATLVGGDAQVGASAAGNAAQNNWLNHVRPSLLALSEKERYDAASAGCAKGDSQACTEQRNLAKLSAQRDQNLASACAGGEGCMKAASEARAAGNQVVVGADGKVYALPQNYQLFYDSQGRVVSAVPADTPQLKAPERAGNTWQNAAGQGLAEFVLIDGAGLLGSALIKGGGLLFGVVTKSVGGAGETVSALGLVAERGGANSAGQLATRERVLANIEATREVNASSNIGAFVQREGRVQESLGIWPPNSGGYAPVSGVTLPVGSSIDRYGFPGGSFVSPTGTPFAERALPSTYQTSKPYFQYDVVKEIPDVTQAKILPWFGQKGTGTQYQLPRPVQWYLDNDYLKPAGK